MLNNTTSATFKAEDAIKAYEETHLIPTQGVTFWGVDTNGQKSYTGCVLGAMWLHKHKDDFTMLVAPLGYDDAGFDLGFDLHEIVVIMNAWDDDGIDKAEDIHSIYKHSYREEDTKLFNEVRKARKEILHK